MLMPMAMAGIGWEMRHSKIGAVVWIWMHKSLYHYHQEMQNWAL
jgi:hypothetical protein